MNEKNELIVSLLHKSINGLALTETEKSELENWISLSEHNRDLYNEVMNSESMQNEVKSMLNYDSKALWKKINRQIHLQQPRNRFITFFRDLHPLQYAAAAVLLILISTTAYLMFVKPDADQYPALSSRQLLPMWLPGLKKLFSS
jgi:hypothetical protein